MVIMRAGRSPALLIRLLALSVFPVVAMLIACGSGGDDAGLTFDFDDVPEEVAAAPAPTLDPFGRLVDATFRRDRLDYLYDLWAMSVELESNRRSFVRLVEDAQSETVDVDWVIDVHTAHRLSEELRVRAYGYSIPEHLAADYLVVHASFLEAMQVYALAADRVVGASFVIGPGGRTSADLLPAEASHYRSLLGESFYYLTDAEVLTTRFDDDLREIFASLRLR